MDDFAKRLKDIPEWNQNLIDELFERLQKSCNKDILSNLIKSVWIANVQILSAIRINKNQSETEVNVPDPKRFVHKCFVEGAREIYKDPYLFNPNCDTVQSHRNQRDLLKLISSSTKDAIRKMLPVEEILRQYLVSPVLVSAAIENTVVTDAKPGSQEDISDQELKNILNEIDKNPKKESKPDDDSSSSSSSSDSEDAFVPSMGDRNPKKSEKDESANESIDETSKKQSDSDSDEKEESKEDRKDDNDDDDDHHHKHKHHHHHHKGSDDEKIEVPIDDRDKSNKSKSNLFFNDKGISDRRFI
jgi:DNA-binding TFAR19-related protein (PDSD5 family)